VDRVAKKTPMRTCPVKRGPERVRQVPRAKKENGKKSKEKKTLFGGGKQPSERLGKPSKFLWGSTQLF